MDTDFDTRLKVPMQMFLAGPSGAGKTTILRQILDNLDTLFVAPFERIIWAYGIEAANMPRDDPRVLLVDGPPDMRLLDNVNGNTLLIIDDLMLYYAKHPDELKKLFTVVGHHKRVSIIFVVQNLFGVDRTARSNSHYICLCHTADKLQIRSLASQLFASQAKMFMEAYDDAISSPFGYLVIDNTPRTPAEFRLSCQRFHDNAAFYIPRKAP